MDLKKFIAIITILLFIIVILQPFSISKILFYNEKSQECDKRIYHVDTIDGSSITLTRFLGLNRPSVIFIHGMSGSHQMFDWNKERSLARFLNNNGWDVWLLDLRTHDTDGDFLFDKDCNDEYINRYWDFDNTLCKIDVVTAVDFIKDITNCEKVVLGGHSYGGYLAYAYTMLVGEENLAGIIATGSSPYAQPKELNPSKFKMIKYGFYIGKKAFVNPFGMPRTIHTRLGCMNTAKKWEPSANSVFYYTTTPLDIQKELFLHLNDEAAGVWVDMFFGKNIEKYNGDWVDPQTLYNYSDNLHKITVPILFIAGENDTQDPSLDIYRAYQNVSSIHKEFYSFKNHSHMDILLGDYSKDLIYPKIDTFLETL